MVFIMFLFLLLILFQVLFVNGKVDHVANNVSASLLPTNLLLGLNDATHMVGQIDEVPAKVLSYELSNLSSHLSSEGKKWTFICLTTLQGQSQLSFVQKIFFFRESTRLCLQSLNSKLTGLIFFKKQSFIDETHKSIQY